MNEKELKEKIEEKVLTELSNELKFIQTRCNPSIDINDFTVRVSVLCEKMVRQSVRLTLQERNAEIKQIIEESRGMFVTDEAWRFFKQKLGLDAIDSGGEHES